MALFGVFGKKKKEIDKIQVQEVNTNNYSSSASSGYDEPVIPTLPGVDDNDIPIPDSKTEIPKFDMNNNDNLYKLDVNLDYTSDFNNPTEDKEENTIQNLNREMIKKDDIDTGDFEDNAQSEFSKPEFDSLKNAVGEPIKSSVINSNKSRVNEEELPDFDESAEQGVSDFFNKPSLSKDIKESHTINIEDKESEELQELEINQKSKDIEEDQDEEAEIPNFFGSETLETENSPISTDLPSFDKIKQVKQDTFLPAFEIRETKSNEQLFIDARDYEKLLKEINAIDILARRTVKELMKIKDVSGNETKLFTKYHAELVYINDKLAYIDSVLFGK
ncbi:MAG: hypothetical protein QXG00_01830 [Candidatus Woesearchaeota archaeon]